MARLSFRKQKRRGFSRRSIEKFLGGFSLVMLFCYFLFHAFLISRRTSYEGQLDTEMEQSPLRIKVFEFLRGGKYSYPAPLSFIRPIDLSVNHLQKIDFWDGALPPGTEVGSEEDFLPIVTEENIDLRWRMEALSGAPFEAMKDISAYRIIALQAGERDLSSAKVLWDTDKVLVKTMPHSVAWAGSKIEPGTIVMWKVLLWDALGKGPTESKWSKFGVGPGPNEWKAKWITHKGDFETLENTTRSFQSYGNMDQNCERFKKRLPLPLIRGHASIPHKVASQVVSALLVVGGLGSFSVSLDGKVLSSSSILDPPMTDFTKRVFYRGFDVSEAFKHGGSHVIGITLGSGWWDPLPIQGDMLSFTHLPTGPLTAISQLHLTFSDGSTSVKFPTDASNEWQIGKGFIMESNLFGTEQVNLALLEKSRGWDTPAGLNDMTSEISWSDPIVYKSPVTFKEWHDIHSGFALKREKAIVPNVAPIGQLIPAGAPPVLPIERVKPDSVLDLGNGRWLFDFGKGMSGILRFENGLPNPIKPQGEYPRSHLIDKSDDYSFVTVIYGDSLEMTTGDINTALVAGTGLHSGGPRHISKGSRPAKERAGPCFPAGDGEALAQKDVFVIPNQEDKGLGGSFSDVRQVQFVSHGFRFAEVCCTETPPTDVYAIKYRSAFQDWGKFDSSNVVLNGLHEMTKNAYDSNTLGIQSDCPHRERLQYGGDLLATSTAGMHLYDMSAFYGKVIKDFTDAQLDTGGYTPTSTYIDILHDYSIFHNEGGEMAWATLAPVLTARHMQHYGDSKLVKDSLRHHIEWLTFLNNEFDQRLQIDKNQRKGLCDWYAITDNDKWMCNHMFYMASARSVAYLLQQHKTDENGETLENQPSISTDAAMAAAKRMIDLITSNYIKADGLFTSVHKSPGADMALFARLVNAEKRCDVLKQWLAHTANDDFVTWPGDEEQLFHEHLPNETLNKMLEEKSIIRARSGKLYAGYTRRSHLDAGIFGIRFTLKTLSEMGFHDVALSKATGEGMPGYEQMLSFNATTLWETWWRSEDVYSRNHVMFGAAAEWLASSVAGVELLPTTTGGNELLFWPQIPVSPKNVRFASATQGTKRGDASIAWKFYLPSDVGQDNTVSVHIRMLVPPGSKATLKVETRRDEVLDVTHAEELPDIMNAKAQADRSCLNDRKEGKGFNYNWEYDRKTELWEKVSRTKAIGTPCESYLFNLGEVKWIPQKRILGDNENNRQVHTLDLVPGLYKVTISNRKLEDVSQKSYRRLDPSLIGPYCSDPDTTEWDISDATHLI